MASPSIERLEKLLGTPRDGALLRFSLGMEHLKIESTEKAIEYLSQAVGRDRGYSAAWRALGRALEAAGRPQDALAAFRDGIAAAQAKGDKQAEKEMAVFARRIEKRGAG
jgi:tetratricopeptide (TPR) repeat protein